MREKTRKLILSIFLAACIVALMAASLSYTLTNGRYTGGELSEDSPYDDIIDFVGATKYTVSTPEELVNAIENGYSYIEIDKNAPNPFVINSDIADVATNLVLNVNGHIVVRNSRNPLINVQKNVSVVLVYDSESIDESTPEEDMGGFYNPVGSALQASGGTLTVGAGIYESGPDADNQTKTYTTGTEVTLFSRGDDRTAAYPEAGTSATDLPILQGKAVGTDEFVYDYYFQEKPSDVNALIEADTYLIYTEEKNAYIPTEGENAGKLIVNAEEVTGEEGTTTTVSGDEFFVPCNVASCDFYYYYPVADTESTVGSGDQTQTVQTYAVVYGYHDVKGLASNKDNAAETLQEKGLVWPYAAIRSEAGSAYARGGEFHTYFGTVNTYGIYSSGGIMTVGGEASADPEFSARGQGTCIYMAADESGDETDNILTIDSGTFSSEIGDTIKMFGGKMNVKAGTFTKTGCKKDTENDQIDNQTAIISLQGGTLTVDGTKSGDENAPVYSVTMKAGGDANGGTLQNVFGIRAVGGGKITTEGVSFDIYGDYSAGVLSYDGTINLGSDTLINVVQSENTTVLTSAGVSSEQASSEASGIQQEEDHPVNLTGNVTINSNGLGITARGVVNVTGKGVAVTTTRGTGIYVNKGEFNVETGASITVKSTVLSGYSWATPPKSGTTDTSNNEPNIYNGVYVQGGSLESNGTLNVAFTGLENDNSGDYSSQQIKSYAVRVEQAASGKDTKVTIASGSITNSVGGGVYVGGGTVELGDESTKAGPTVKTTGKLLYASVKAETGWPWQETTYSWDGWKHAVGTSWPYMLNKSGGHAVEVSGGSLTVHGGSYSAQQGNGILIRNTSGNQISNQVTINSGSFTGYNGGYYISYDNNYGYSGTPLGGDRMVGPAASYGLNVMGHDLNVTINGGSFGETGETGNSAASFFGTSGGVKADVNVYGGTFNATNADAISIFRYIDITFDGTAISSNIGGTADVASLSVQDDLLYTNDSNRGSTITLNNGTFTGTAYGVWYACGYDRLSISGNATIKGVAGVQVASAPVVENGINISGGTIEGSTDGIYYGSRAAVNDGLVITGGQIKGTNRYGFYFNQNPWSDENGVATNNVAITGGTFIGGSSAFWANTNDDRGQNAAEQIKTTDIFKSHTSEQIGWCYDDEDRVIAYRRGSYPYTYYHVGGDNSISLNGLMSASAGINSFYLNDFKTIKIKNVKVTNQGVLEDNWEIHKDIYS